MYNTLKKSIDMYNNVLYNAKHTENIFSIYINNLRGLCNNSLSAVTSLTDY